jgi:nucleotide-binding universal stress UspA family protein
MATGGTIMCGVNGSSGGQDALQVAKALSERLGLRLVVVHVAQANRGPDDADDVLGEVTSRAQLHGALEQRITSGDRATRLAEVAAEEGADLIILGSPGGRGLRRRGTLARELESATSCPVLVTPPLTRRRSELRLARAQAVGAS